uniref:Putative secreted protein n=1 Tax=Ixodes ricinus TaxID=34613 RepID=A0A6B0UBK9_IXORI
MICTSVLGLAAGFVMVVFAGPPWDADLWQAGLERRARAPCMHGLQTSQPNFRRRRESITFVVGLQGLAPVLVRRWFSRKRTLKSPSLRSSL